MHEVLLHARVACGHSLEEVALALLVLQIGELERGSERLGVCRLQHVELLPGPGSGLLVKLVSPGRWRGCLHGAPVPVELVEIRAPDHELHAVGHLVLKGEPVQAEGVLQLGDPVEEDHHTP